MSISMFFVSPKTTEEKRFNLPVCTEDAFRKAVLPAAERAGSQLVPLFEIGYELSNSEAPALVSELQNVAIQLKPDISDAAIYSLPRILNLQTEIERIFNLHPEAILYIG